MSDLTLPDDLKEWQDALEDRDVAKQAYDSYTGDLRVKALLAEVLIGTRHRLEMLRKEHMTTAVEIGPALPTGSRDDRNPHELDETYGIYSEDEYHDNRERGRNIR